MYRGKGNTEGYCKRRRSMPRPEELARDIATSIEAHRANGVDRAPELYTANPETIREVHRLLSQAC